MDIIAELKKLLEILTTVFENMYATATHFFVVLFTSRFATWKRSAYLQRDYSYCLEQRAPFKELGTYNKPSAATSEEEEMCVNVQKSVFLLVCLYLYWRYYSSSCHE